MKKNKKVYAIPFEELTGNELLVDGQEFQPTMVGSYFHSSLEISCCGTPQYSNAGDILAPVHKDVRELMKPKLPYGTFGALIEDDTLDEYRIESGRQLVELPTLEDMTVLETKLSNTFGSQVYEQLDDEFRYQTRDGRQLTLEQAIQEQMSYKEHNDQVQRQIDLLIEERGYAPTYEDGKKRTKKFPDSLLSEIAQLAKQKKSVTGFNIKFQVFGKHTVATHNNYVKCSNESQKQELENRVNYRKKGTFLQGNVRMASIIIPIQNIRQLKRIKQLLIGNCWSNIEQEIVDRQLRRIILSKGVSEEIQREWKQRKSANTPPQPSVSQEPTGIDLPQ